MYFVGLGSALEDRYRVQECGCDVFATSSSSNWAFKCVRWDCEIAAYMVR